MVTLNIFLASQNCRVKTTVVSRIVSILLPPPRLSGVPYLCDDTSQLVRHVAISPYRNANDQSHMTHGFPTRRVHYDLPLLQVRRSGPGQHSQSPYILRP